MKVFLVQPPFPKPDRYPPVGLAYLAAVLRQHGVPVALVDMPALGLAEFRHLRPLIEREDPAVLGFPFYTCQSDIATELAQNVKAAFPGVCLVAGGIHPSLLPVETLTEMSDLDFLIHGEGEQAFLGFVRALGSQAFAPAALPGLAWRDARKRVVVNPPAPLVEDLDSLPFPAWDLLPIEKYSVALPSNRYVRLANAGLVILSSRGCPYRCIFCNSNAVFGDSYRVRSPANVVAEMEYLIANFGIREFDFLDETMTIGFDRVEELCRLIRERDLKVAWSVNSRINTITEPMVKRLKEAGCTRVDFGIESGSDRVLKVIRKNLTVGRIREVFAFVERQGMPATALMMVGHPTETLADVKASVKLILELYPDFPEFQIATPLPGTELHAIAVRNGWLRTMRWSEYVIGGLRVTDLPVMRNEAFDFGRLRDLRYFAQTVAQAVVRLKPLLAHPVPDENEARRTLAQLMAISPTFEPSAALVEQKRRSIQAALLARIELRRAHELIDGMEPVAVAMSVFPTESRPLAELETTLPRAPARILALRTATTTVSDVLIDRLRSAFSGARLDLACQKSVADYYGGNRNLDRILAFGDGMLGAGNSLSILRDAAGREAYDLLVVLYNGEYPIDYAEVDRQALALGIRPVWGLAMDGVIPVDDGLVRLKEQLLLARREFAARAESHLDELLALFRQAQAVTRRGNQ